MRILDVTNEEFRPYGEKLCIDTSEFVDYLIKKAKMPKEGNIYVRDELPMHTLKGEKSIAEAVYGCSPIQIGYCNGFNSRLNALEYHSCPEVDIAAEEQILLLALQSDIREGYIDSSKVKAFLLRKGDAVLLRPYIFHFSPCKRYSSGFHTAIILTNGTNSELKEKPLDKRLWMENKWLFAHKDSPQAKKGAYIGISGENILVPYL